MRRIIEPLCALALLWLSAAGRLPAQGASLAAASIAAAPGSSEEYDYRLEFAAPKAQAGSLPRLDIGASEEVGILSLSVRPLRGERTEALIRFKAKAEGGFLFPPIRVSWNGESLVVPARAVEGRSRAAGSPTPGTSPKAERLPPEPLPPEAEGAAAIGDFRLEAGFDRARASPGEIVYLEVRILGTGDFKSAKPPRIRLVSGRAKAGPPRRYPDYGAKGGSGRLVFRFPIEVVGAGEIGVLVEAYPVYDPGTGRLLPGQARELSLPLLAPAPTPSAGGEKPARRGAGLAKAVIAALCLALAAAAFAAGIILLAGRKASGGEGGSKRRPVAGYALLCLGAVIALAGGVAAFSPLFNAEKPRGLRLGPGTRIYAVPSDKARSWTEEGSYAEIVGKARDEEGREWIEIEIEDAGSGWIRAED